MRNTIRCPDGKISPTSQCSSHLRKPQFLYKNHLNIPEISNNKLAQTAMAKSLLILFRSILSASFVSFIKDAMISTFGGFMTSPFVSEELCSETDCAICLGKIRRATALRCGHAFHKECLDGWMKKSRGKTCPLCRDYLIDGGSSATKNDEGEDGGLIRSNNNVIIISPFVKSRSRDLCWIR